MLNACLGIFDTYPSPHKIFISTQGIVNEEALAALLRSGHLHGAALDVLSTEPDIPACLIGLEDRVILTPHTAFYSDQGYAEMREKGCREVLRMIRGEPLRNCVNKPSC